MKDCYRTYDDLRALLGGLDLPLCAEDVPEMLSKWMVDNGYQLERYEIPDEDIEDGFKGPHFKPIYIDKEVLKERERRGELKRGTTDSLDLNDLIIPPAMDRCPEDMLKEEVEDKGPASEEIKK